MPGGKPLLHRVDEHIRDLPVVLALEETEEPRIVVVKLVVPEIPCGGYPADRRSSAVREKLLNFCMGEKGILLLRVNQILFTPEHYAFLQEEFQRLPSREHTDVSLDTDVDNILQFIRGQNMKHSLVTQKLITTTFHISKVTAQRRIEDLVAKGLIISKKKGRSKYLYATETADEFFEKRRIL